MSELTRLEKTHEWKSHNIMALVTCVAHFGACLGIPFVGNGCIPQFATKSGNEASRSTTYATPFLEQRRRPEASHIYFNACFTMGVFHGQQGCLQTATVVAYYKMY